MSLSFCLFFCNNLYFSLSLFHPSDQSFVPLLLLLLPFTVTSPSSFQGHGQIPPSTSIFFFIFLSWSNHLSTTSTNLRQKNHMNQNPQEPQELKPTSIDSVNLKAPISTANTDPQASKPITVDPRTLI